MLGMRHPIAFVICLCAWRADAQPKIPVKVVVVAMFERGADTGDEPGEYQYWVEREKLDRVIPFPQGYHDLRMNRDGVLGILTGVGTAKAAASIMALGLDPRFDLTKAYWLVAGIAGVDPADATLGSAAWAEYVVDGDLAHEIDAREIPADWKTGYVPLRKSVPYEQPRVDLGESLSTESQAGGLGIPPDRAYRLPDDDKMRAERELFASPNARRPPFVLKGDTLSASTFWHGKLLNEWANDWVKYHTGGNRQLRHDGDGGHRYSAIADVSFESGPRRYQSRAGTAYRERFRSACAGPLSGREPGSEQNRQIYGLLSGTRSRLAGRPR